MTEEQLIPIIIWIVVGGLLIYVAAIIRNDFKKYKKAVVVKKVLSNDFENKSTNEIKEYKTQIAELNEYIRRKSNDYYDLELKFKNSIRDLAMAKSENEKLQKQILNRPDNNISTKECPACKRIQPTTEFKQNHNHGDGLTKWCRTCLAEGAPMPNDLSGTKTCEKCGQHRRKTSFYPSSKSEDGLSKWCKFCFDKAKKRSR